MAARIRPLEPPLAPALQAQLDALMRGRPPLRLFTTLARDERLWSKFAAGSLLDRGHLTVRQRELVIGRTTARCRAEYEWGVHIATFGAKAGLTEPQVHALVHGDADDKVWGADDRLLIALSDALHDDCDIDDALWQALGARFSDEALLELLMLAGFYRTVSYLVNALRLPLEPQSPRFPCSSRIASGRTLSLQEPENMQRALISSGSPFETEIAYSRAVVQGDWIFVSGTTGFDYATMTIADRVEAQTEQCLENIDHALSQAGATLADVVRVHYILPNGDDFARCWPVLRRYFDNVRPAATMICAKLLDPRMLIEIEVTALRRGS